MPENGQEKTPYIPKIAQFLKDSKNDHFAKAIAKQNGHKWCILGLTEPQNTKNIQKLPFKIIKVVLCRKLLKTHLIIKK